MTDFVFLDTTFLDANTGEVVRCDFDRVAHPDAWGMVRFHPHAPVKLLYPPSAPTYVHELEGIAQDAVLGVLARTSKPGLYAGLEAVVDKLSTTRNRLEHPPGQRGNPLPVADVIRQAYARLFPQDVDDDETNIYRMQVYTWRLSDVVRVCKKLLLDPDALFRTRTSPEPATGFLNFAGDSHYADDIRLREPNCEPLRSDATEVFAGAERRRNVSDDEGKYRVSRKAPGSSGHARDRPATYHNNYSEITGKPDPLHDFGIKHWRNDAGQVRQKTKKKYSFLNSVGRAISLRLLLASPRIPWVSDYVSLSKRVADYPKRSWRSGACCGAACSLSMVRRVCSYAANGQVSWRCVCGSRIRRRAA
jgi:hypothetical protein